MWLPERCSWVLTHKVAWNEHITAATFRLKHLWTRLQRSCTYRSDNYKIVLKALMLSTMWSVCSNGDTCFWAHNWKCTASVLYLPVIKNKNGTHFYHSMDVIWVATFCLSMRWEISKAICCALALFRTGLWKNIVFFFFCFAPIGGRIAQQSFSNLMLL